jgi:hypothetical protein
MACITEAKIRSKTYNSMYMSVLTPLSVCSLAALPPKFRHLQVKIQVPEYSALKLPRSYILTNGQNDGLKGR